MRRWGRPPTLLFRRIVTIVLSTLNLMKMPIGTLVGAYGLWVMLSIETEELFRPSSGV